MYMICLPRRSLQKRISPSKHESDLRHPHSFRLASITKMLSSWAILIACEEGTLHLDQPVAQEGCTLRHLLAHAGGYAFDGSEPIARPGVRRIYSNTGIELAAAPVGSPHRAVLLGRPGGPAFRESEVLRLAHLAGIAATVAAADARA